MHGATVAERACRRCSVAPGRRRRRREPAKALAGWRAASRRPFCRKGRARPCSGLVSPRRRRLRLRLLILRLRMRLVLTVCVWPASRMRLCMHAAGPGSCWVGRCCPCAWRHQRMRTDARLQLLLLRRHAKLRQRHRSITRGDLRTAAWERFHAGKHELGQARRWAKLSTCFCCMCCATTASNASQSATPSSSSSNSTIAAPLNAHEGLLSAGPNFMFLWATADRHTAPAPSASANACTFT